MAGEEQAATVLAPVAPGDRRTGDGAIRGSPPAAAESPAPRGVTEIVAELEALRPAGSAKPARAIVEARALDLIKECAGMRREELLRVEATLHSLGQAKEDLRQWQAAVREAAKIAAFTPGAGAAFLDGRPASWPYTAEDNRLWLLNEISLSDGTTRIQRTPIADFSAQIVETASGEDGSQYWTLAGKTPDGLPFRLEMAATDFADERQLRAQLTQAAGPHAPVRARMGVHLPAAIQLCSRTAPRRLRRFERTGWDDAGHFLLPGREPAGARIVLNQALPYQVTAEADLAKGLVALTDLIMALHPERTMVMLSALVVGPMAKLAGWQNERSALFATGRTGTLKTSTLQTGMCLWGPDFLRDDRLTRWGAGGTENAIMALATYANDLPLLIDNYKPSTGGGARAFRNLIHAIVEGSEKLRLKSTADLRAQRLIACWPCLTGEDCPTDDAASLARTLVLPFDWPRGQPNERLAQAQSQAQHMNAVGRSLLDWLESAESRPVIAAAAAQFATLRGAWSTRVVQANAHATNPLRVASNLAINQLAIWILQQHPRIGPVIAPYLAQHETGLLAVASGMAQSTAESLEAIRFLHALQELLATEELVLLPASGKDAAGNDWPLPLPERRLGWRVDDGTIYLLAQKGLTDVLKRLGPEALGNISLPTLFDQIAALGLIESHGRDGRHTRLVRIAADGGHPHRVLHLKAAALEFSAEQVDA